MKVFVYTRPSKAEAAKQVKDFEWGTLNLEKTAKN